MGVQLTKICNKCNKELPRNSEYFRTYRNKYMTGDRFHDTCRLCEDKDRNKAEWKDGKLRCHCCDNYLDPSEFRLDNTKGYYKIRDFHGTICKSCQKDNQRKLQERLSEKNKLIKILQARWLGARDRAKSKNMYFDLTKEFLLDLWDKQEGKCALTGLDMTYDRYTGRTYTNVSIDRIDTNKGYTKDNVQLVCMAANQAKSDLTDEQLYQVCKGIVDKYESKCK